MILYALVHEKDLFYRSLRQGMGSFESQSPGLQAAGEAACSLLARHLRRYLLRLEKQLSMATFASRLPSVVYRLLSLQKNAP
jgi:hypothetical protein